MTIYMTDSFIQNIEGKVVCHATQEVQRLTLLKRVKQSPEPSITSVVFLDLFSGWGTFTSHKLFGALLCAPLFLP